MNVMPLNHPETIPLVHGKIFLMKLVSGPEKAGDHYPRDLGHIHVLHCLPFFFLKELSKNAFILCCCMVDQWASQLAQW